VAGMFLVGGVLCWLSGNFNASPDSSEEALRIRGSQRRESAEPPEWAAFFK